MGHLGHFCKDLDCSLENKGEEIVITIKGDSKKLTRLEKKLKAMKELCGCGEEGGDDDCCQ